MQSIWRNKENATVCKCTIISCAVKSFLVQIVTSSWLSFMTWLKEGKADHRYFLESVHDWIKTDFMRNKMGSSYITVCCFPLTTPNGKRWSVSPTLPVVSSHSQCVSWYHDLFTTKTKEFSSFFPSVWYMTTFPLACFAWLMIWEQIQKKL